MRIKSDLYILWRWNLQSSLRWWWLILTIVLFCFIGWQSALEAESLSKTMGVLANVNAWDAFLVAFAGPGVWDNSLLKMLTWFVPHLLFFYIIGDLVNGELTRYGYAIIPRIGSRLLWWRSKLCLLMTLATVYPLLGIVAVLVGAIIFGDLPWSWEGSALINSGTLLTGQTPKAASFLAGWSFFLLGSTLLAMASWQTLMAIVWRSSFHGFIGVVVVMLLSWLLGTGNPQIVPYLPGSHSMLIRHSLFEPSVPSFSLGWTIKYNSFLLLVIGVISSLYIRHLDIWGTSEVATR